MISIIIPAYNEEQSIADTVNRCKVVLQQLNVNNGEVIVVDDSSKDKTREVAMQCGAKVISHPHNAGYGRSLKDGIRNASNDIIAITDADGTYPIERIPDLYNEFQKGFDMVVGSRKGKNYDESFKKKMLRIILRNLVEYTAGRKIDDINSGLRIFRRSIILNYFEYLCETFSFTTSLTLAYMMTGKFVKYLPIDYHKRVGKTNVRLFRDTLRTMQYIIEAILFFNPMKIFLVMCALILLFGVMNIALCFIFHLESTFLLAVASIVVAILFFGFGLLAVILKQILMKGKFHENAAK